MRLLARALATGVMALGGGAARAEDWRAIAESHHDVVFVDADSVARQRDGRIRFRARHRLAENESNRDFGYDRIDLAVEGRCPAPGREAAVATSRRAYFLRGRRIAAVDWREEDLVAELPVLADTLCRGMIGYRRFADLDSAMADYAGHDSLERLAAYVTDEVELVGTDSQGFEMNAISLCGSEAGCRAEAPRETCWLESDIHVPTPPGAPEWVDGGPRRDRAGAAFRGRIHRSRGGDGFGHVSAFSCLVEATGPARFVAVPPAPSGPPDPATLGSRPEAVAAHAALVDTIRAASKVEMATGGRSWTLDDLAPGTIGACHSLPRFGGAFLEARTGLPWDQVRDMRREGPVVTLVGQDYDGDLDFLLAHEKAATSIAALARRLSTRKLADLEQRGDRLTLHFSDGTGETLRYADPAEAIRAAGLAEAIRGREIATVRQAGRQVTVLLTQLLTLSFPDEASAAEAMRRIEALRLACAPASS